MEYYDFVKKQIDSLGVSYSAENDRIIEEIKAKLEKAFADFSQADGFYKDYLHRLETEYKPQIDANLVLLGLAESGLSEEAIKLTIAEVEEDKDKEEEPVSELEVVEF